jgi:hypothetical protein
VANLAQGRVLGGRAEANPESPPRHRRYSSEMAAAIKLHNKVLTDENNALWTTLKYMGCIMFISAIIAFLLKWK